MAASVQKIREIVFQLVYSCAFAKSDHEGMVPLLMKQHAISRSAARVMVDQALAIWEVREGLDREIARHAQGFELDRIGMVERALLRQGLFALQQGELPPKVVISEAVRLCKKFATSESGAFVNALLDAYYRDGKPDAIASQSAFA